MHKYWAINGFLSGDFFREGSRLHWAGYPLGESHPRQGNRQRLTSAAQESPYTSGDAASIQTDAALENDKPEVE